MLPPGPPPRAVSALHTEARSCLQYLTQNETPRSPQQSRQSPSCSPHPPLRHTHTHTHTEPASSPDSLAALAAVPLLPLNRIAPPLPPGAALRGKRFPPQCCHLSPVSQALFINSFLKTGAGFSLIPCRPILLSSAPRTCFPAVCPRNGAAGQAGGPSTGCASPGTIFMPGIGRSRAGKKATQSPDICGLIPSLGGQERGVESWRGGGRQSVSVRGSEKQRKGRGRSTHVTELEMEGLSGKVGERRGHSEL